MNPLEELKQKYSMEVLEIGRCELMLFCVEKEKSRRLAFAAAYNDEIIAMEKEIKDGTNEKDSIPGSATGGKHSPYPNSAPASPC